MLIVNDNDIANNDRASLKKITKFFFWISVNDIDLKNIITTNFWLCNIKSEIATSFLVLTTTKLITKNFLVLTTTKLITKNFLVITTTKLITIVNNNDDLYFLILFFFVFDVLTTNWILFDIIIVIRAAFSYFLIKFIASLNFEKFL